MPNDNDFSGAHLVLAFVGGAAAGAAVAYLTTPHSGEESRARLAEELRARSEQVTQQPRALKVASAAAIDAGRQAFRESYENSEEKDSAGEA